MIINVMLLRLLSVHENIVIILYSRAVCTST